MVDQTPTPNLRTVGTPRSTGLTIFVTIITFGIWMFVWSYQNGEEVQKYRGEGLGGVLYLILTLLFYPVTMFLLGDEVEKMYRAEGEEPRITALYGLWFLLPFIGMIIWYVRMQGALNYFWLTRGAEPHSGL